MKSFLSIFIFIFSLISLTYSTGSPKSSNPPSTQTRKEKIRAAIIETGEGSSNSEKMHAAIKGALNVPPKIESMKNRYESFKIQYENARDDAEHANYKANQSWCCLPKRWYLRNAEKHKAKAHELAMQTIDAGIEHERLLNDQKRSSH